MHIPYIHKFCTAVIFFAFWSLLPQKTKGQSMSEDDRQKMKREAQNLVNQYFTDLNNITSGDEAMGIYRDEDINDAIGRYFYSPAVYVYNDLAQPKERDKDSMRVREYMETAYAWYPKGVKFDCSFNVKYPCPDTETRDNLRYYVVKVEVSKTLQGIYKFNNQLHTNNDALDIYIQFVVKQDRPKLILDPAKIYRIAKQDGKDCPVRELIEENKTPFRLPEDTEEREILKERAKLFVKDYALTLNVIGNPYYNDQFNTLDYFESENTTVYNDILTETRRPDFTADSYLKDIERWFQGGIKFKYRKIRAVTVYPEFDHVKVEVQTTRTIRTYGISENDRHRQRLSIMVKFPVVRGDDEGDYKQVVGLERATPRIMSITALPPRVNPRQYIAVGFQILTSNYFGDIAPNSRAFSTDFRRTNPSWGIYLQRKMSEHWYIKLNFIASTLSADDVSASDYDDPSDKYRYIRNLHFRNRIREFTVNGIYEFYRNKGKYYTRRAINPYITFGIGLFRNKPEARLPTSSDNITTPWIGLRQLGTEGQGRDGYRGLYAIMQPVIPFGVGMRYKLSRRLDLNFEISGRFTFTDFIDDVSGVYPNYDDFGNDNLAISMSNRTLEPFNAFNKQSRAVGLDYFLDTGGQLFTYTGRNGRTYNTINGYGRQGDKRGTAGNRDYYVMVGFHLHYLLNVGPQKLGQKSTKTEIKYDFDK